MVVRGAGWGSRAKVVAAAIAEVDHERVRLRGLAVSLELLEVLELGIWAEAAVDHLDCPGPPMFSEMPIIHVHKRLQLIQPFEYHLSVPRH